MIMKVINPENEFPAYQKLLNQLEVKAWDLVLWQNHPVTGKRQVSLSKLKAIQWEEKLLHFALAPEVEIDTTLQIFCYSKEEQIIFKSNISEIRDQSLMVHLPVEIQCLEESILKTMAQRSARDQEFLSAEFASIDEEDRLFADKRESPRARPKEEKWVKMKLAHNEVIHRLKLFDLSRGGMSFVSFDVEIFPKGTEIHLIGVDVHELDDPLVGKIVSQRPIDEDQSAWKIGVRFEDGQS